MIVDTSSWVMPTRESARFQDERHVLRRIAHQVEGLLPELHVLERERVEHAPPCKRPSTRRLSQSPRV